MRSVVLAIVIVAVAITVLNVFRETQRQARIAESKSSEIADILAVSLTESVAGGDVRAIQNGLRAVGRVPGLEYAIVNDSNGNRLAEFGGSVAVSNEGFLFSLTPEMFRPLLGGATRATAAIIKGGVGIGSLTVQYRPDRPWRSLLLQLEDVLIASAIAMALAMVLAYRRQRSIVLPLQHLGEAMTAAYRDRDYERTVIKESDDEIGDMVEIFNAFMSQIRIRDFHMARQTVVQQELLEKIGEDSDRRIDDQLRLQESVTGELADTLTGVDEVAERLAATDLTYDQARYLKELRAIGARGLALLTDARDLTAYLRDRSAEPPVAFDNHAMLDEVVEAFGPLVEARGLDMAVSVGSDCPRMLRGRPEIVRLVLGSMLAQSLAATRSGFILLKVERLEPDEDEQPEIRYTVIDTGEGHGAAARESLMQAVVPVAVQRQGDGEGEGPGPLAIGFASRYAEAIGGRVSLISDPGYGSAFGLTLPLETGPEPDAAPVGPTVDKVMVCVDGEATLAVISEVCRALQVRFEIATAAGLGKREPAKSEIALIDGRHRAALGGKDTAEAGPGGAGRRIFLERQAADGGMAPAEAGTLLRPLRSYRFATLLAGWGEGKPAADKPAVTAKAGESSRTDGAGNRVLVVEPDRLSRELALESLNGGGRRPTVVGSLEQALVAIGNGHYDVIFLSPDLTAPDADRSAFATLRDFVSSGEGAASTRYVMLPSASGVGGQAPDEDYDFTMDGPLSASAFRKAMGALAARSGSGGATAAVRKA